MSRYGMSFFRVQTMDTRKSIHILGFLVYMIHSFEDGRGRIGECKQGPSKQNSFFKRFNSPINIRPPPRTLA